MAEDGDMLEVTIVLVNEGYMPLRRLGPHRGISRRRGKMWNEMSGGVVRPPRNYNQRVTMASIDGAPVGKRLRPSHRPPTRASTR